MLKKIIFANFQRIIDYFTLNLKLRPYIWVWDPGSVKYLFRIPDSKNTGSGFATLVKSKVSSLTFQVMSRLGITELKW
jgi:hypothetical protein